MISYCPNCEHDRDFSVIDGTEDIEVRGERIPVHVHYLKCPSCAREYSDPSSEYDPLLVAFRAYRDRKGLLQPEEIVAFRKNWGLTQQELANLLGWGVASLSRYENGSLQNAGHDRQLRQAMQPSNLGQLLITHGATMTEKRLHELTSLLKESDARVGATVPACIELEVMKHGPDRFTGFRPPDFDRVTQAVLYFADGTGVCRTMLNKLLWYADFLNFKRHGVSITGLRYRHHIYGPVPVDYDLIYAGLVSKGALEIDERAFGNDVNEYYVARLPVCAATLSAAELDVLKTVKARFGRWTARRLSDTSHKERAYTETQLGQLIPYDYANTIST